MMQLFAYTVLVSMLLLQGFVRSCTRSLCNMAFPFAPLGPPTQPCMQVCMGWVLPIWAAVLSETDARSTFAAQNPAHLLPEEREWALAAAVGSEWAAMIYQFPMLCLTAWHLLLAATAAAARASHASGSGGWE